MHTETHHLSLVLGGGGGKGGAHLGVLSVLESVRLPIDSIIGTSIGGTMGIMYAAGYRIDELAEVLRSMTMWRLFERDATGMGLLGCRNTRTTLTNLLGDATFEDLSLPCAVVATDLVTAREVVIDSGPLVDALMATMALPGIFPPVEYGTMLLADGGVLNNLPVDVAYARGADKVLAVDLGTVCDDFALEPTSGSAKVMRSLWSSQPLTLANRGLAVMMAHMTSYRISQSPPDLLLCPEVEHIGALEMHRVDEGHSAGVEVAWRAMTDLLLLREWRKQDEELPTPVRGFRQRARAVGE